MKRIASATFVLAGAVTSFAWMAYARDRAPPTKPAETAPEPVPADPQTTTASFGDWVVRCVVVGKPAHRTCEASQSLVVGYQGRQVPIAQVAFGHPAAAAPLQLTVLLPVNVSFDKPVRIGADDQHLVTLAFRRCLPSGCFASAQPDPGAISGFRGAIKPGRLLFTDGREQTLTLPLSFRGLAQALEDLDKER